MFRAVDENLNKDLWTVNSRVKNLNFDFGSAMIALAKFALIMLRR
jgi:hypothetical protein